MLPDLNYMYSIVKKGLSKGQNTLHLSLTVEAYRDYSLKLIVNDTCDTYLAVNKIYGMIRRPVKGENLFTKRTL